MLEELESLRSFLQTFSVPMPTGFHGLNAVVYVFEPLRNECNLQAYPLYSVDEFISMPGS
jgi:hypothetical protein